MDNVVREKCTTNLWCTCRVIDLLGLLEHHVETHVDIRVAFDQVLEFGDDVVPGPGVLGQIFKVVLVPVHHGLGIGEPSRTGWNVRSRHCAVYSEKKVNLKLQYEMEART